VFRSLAHYWRINLAVMLGGAVATSVLTGALMVGDSVRGSLRDLTLDRLGRITDALVADRFFREDLAGELASSGEAEVAPIVFLRGAAVSDSGARASRVAMIGADERFEAMYGEDAGALAVLFGERPEGQLFPSVVVNESLRRELGVEVGDSLVLSFTRFSYVPRDSLMGDKDPDDVLARFRVSLAEVIPDRGIGRFGLSPHQGTPLNAFIALGQLQRVLGQEGSVNGAVIETPHGTEAAEEVLKAAVGLSDYGMTVERGVSHFDVASRELVLRDDVAAAIAAAAVEVGAPAMPIQTYLANTIVGNGNLLPYSMVAAADPLGGPGTFSLTFEDGSTAPPLADDGIYLSTWAARDLSVRPGDTVEIAYYVVGPNEELSTAITELRLDGVVEMEGLAADRDLVPDYPGLQESEDISAWDPPFPVDLRLIREEDEEYWDEHGATPKAFVSAATGKRLWTTRFGSTTSVRIGAVPGKGLRSSVTAFREALLARLEPAAFGFRFRPVRQQGLDAAALSDRFLGPSDRPAVRSRRTAARQGDRSVESGRLSHAHRPGTAAGRGCLAGLSGRRDRRWRRHRLRLADDGRAQDAVASRRRVDGALPPHRAREPRRRLGHRGGRDPDDDRHDDRANRQGTSARAPRGVGESSLSPEGSPVGVDPGPVRHRGGRRDGVLRDLDGHAVVSGDRLRHRGATARCGPVLLRGVVPGRQEARHGPRIGRPCRDGGP